MTTLIKSKYLLFSFSTWAKIFSTFKDSLIFRYLTDIDLNVKAAPVYRATLLVSVELYHGEEHCRL